LFGYPAAVIATLWLGYESRRLSADVAVQIIKTCKRKTTNMIFIVEGMEKGIRVPGLRLPIVVYDKTRVSLSPLRPLKK